MVLANMTLYFKLCILAGAYHALNYSLATEGYAQLYCLHYTCTSVRGGVYGAWYCNIQPY